MMQKIATCCYCGTRAALILRGKERHELACSSCGAPLRDLKMLRSDATGNREPIRRQRSNPNRPAKRRMTGTSLRRWVFEEVWDVAEDLFDIFD